jgi:hypothetical protein
MNGQGKIFMRWRYHQLILFGLLIAALFALRVLRYPTTEMTNDEVWFVWQTFGTPRQIIQWTPYNWGPLFPLLIGFWRIVTGIHPDVIRVLTVLLFLPACAAIFRVARRLWGGSAGWIALIVYGTVGYGIYLTTLLYGYALEVALMPFALWFTVRYFDHPSIKRALLLCVVLAAMLYTHPTGVIAVGILGLFTIPLYGFAIWRWVLPGGLAALLALPEFFSKIQLTMGATNAYSGGLQKGNIFVTPLQSTLSGLAHGYAEMGSGWWIPMYLLASFGLLLALYRHRQQRKIFALGLWLFALIPLHYVDQFLIIYDPPKHMWWLTTVIALWIAGGLTQFPRWIGTLWAVGALAIGFSPLPTSFYGSTRPPFIDNFSFLAQHYHDGDAVVIDPKCTTAPPEEWDYFTQAYFPNGLNVVTNPGTYRRVWYVSRAGQEDPATLAQIKDHRVAGIFVGPWNFLFRLYEAPPNVQGVLFANGFRFHGAEIEDSDLTALNVRRPGETVTIKLWWSVDVANLQGYSASVGILAPDGLLIAQADGEPRSIETQQVPAQWPVGQVFTEERHLVLSEPLATAPYQVYLTVYRPDQNIRIDAPGTNAQKVLPLDILYVKSDRTP